MSCKVKGAGAFRIGKTQDQLLEACRRGISSGAIKSLIWRSYLRLLVVFDHSFVVVVVLYLFIVPCSTPNMWAMIASIVYCRVSSLTTPLYSSMSLTTPLYSSMYVYSPLLRPHAKRSEQWSAVNESVYRGWWLGARLSSAATFARLDLLNVG